MPTQPQSVERKITVLISGSGTNLQALIDACNAGVLSNTRIIRVISNRKNAYGLVRAENAGIATAYHNLLAYKAKHANDTDADNSTMIARREYDIDLAGLILVDEPDMVVCAGWMHILAPAFLEILQLARVPVINLHPALPGHFNGANAIQRAHSAFQAGETDHTGVMIHYVISEVDMGKPIVTKKIEMREGESLEDLETRIHSIEHQLIVQGTAIALGELPCEQSTASS